MAIILHIETSTEVCSVALSRDGYCIWESADMGLNGLNGLNGSNSSNAALGSNSSNAALGSSGSSGSNAALGGKGAKSSKAAERLPSLVDEALEELMSTEHIDAVSVSGGPGSYTGLRIGVSMAKGVAYGQDAKLIAVPTLQTMCVPVLLNPNRELEDDALLCPMIDARRMEVFAAIYDRALNVVRQTQADIVDADTYKEYLDEHPVYFFGNGATKCKEVIDHPNAHFIDNIYPLAKNMMPLAEKAFHKGQFEDVAYYTPDYGKEYEAKLPSSKLLGGV